MDRIFAALILAVAGSLPAAAADGLVSLRSPHDVETTVQHLLTALEAKGLTVFAQIDHAAGAEKAGRSLPPTRLVVFGNPKVGTPLMECARTVAIDLPQKALVWEDAAGQVWFSYNDPQYLDRRHGVGECGGVPARVGRVLEQLAAAATGPR